MRATERGLSSLSETVTGPSFSGRVALLPVNLTADVLDGSEISLPQIVDPPPNLSASRPSMSVSVVAVNEKAAGITWLSGSASWSRVMVKVGVPPELLSR